MGFERVLPYWRLFLGGAAWCVVFSAVCLCLALLIGVAGGFARLSANRAVRALAAAYVTFARGTPLLIQVLLIHFGLPALGIRLGAVGSGVVALALYSGGYVTEITRGGIQAIGRGQMEAARSLGLSYWQAMRHVVFPQALRIMVPSLGNELVILIKNSSILSVLGIVELTLVAHETRAVTNASFAAFIIIGLIYFGLTQAVSALLRRLERRLAVGY